VWHGRDAAQCDAAIAHICAMYSSTFDPGGESQICRCYVRECSVAVCTLPRERPGVHKCDHQSNGSQSHIAARCTQTQSRPHCQIADTPLRSHRQPATHACTSLMLPLQGSPPSRSPSTNASGTPTMCQSPTPEHFFGVFVLVATEVERPVYRTSGSVRLRHTTLPTKQTDPSP